MQKKKKREYKMNQNDIIYMTKNQEVQANIFTMMAISDSGLISAIMINIFSSMIFGINTLYILTLGMEQPLPGHEAEEGKENTECLLYTRNCCRHLTSLI